MQLSAIVGAESNPLLHSNLLALLNVRDLATFCLSVLIPMNIFDPKELPVASDEALGIHC